MLMKLLSNKIDILINNAGITHDNLSIKNERRGVEKSD